MEKEVTVTEALNQISVKLDKAAAILNAFGEWELLTKDEINQTDACALMLAHKQNSDLYYAASDYLCEATTDVNNLLATVRG